MASIGSLPFMIETKTESSVLLHSNNNRRLRFPGFTHRPGRSIEVTGINAEVVGMCSRQINWCTKGKLWKIEPLRATGKVSVEGEDGGEPEDALRATIEKSKKVLAMQRDLLQQVISAITLFYNENNQL